MDHNRDIPLCYHTAVVSELLCSSARSALVKHEAVAECNGFGARAMPAIGIQQRAIKAVAKQGNSHPQSPALLGQLSVR